MPVSAADLHPVDPRLAPLAQAVGRAVLGAAALEKMLLIDIAQRHAERDGLREELDQELSRLERQPAGALLGSLREFGISPELADDIQDVIARRNHLVHHFMEDVEVVAVFAGADVGPLVERVDHLAADCQRVINEIAPAAFAGAEKALGVTLPELIEAVKSVDLEAIEDVQLREQLTLARAMGDQFSSLRRPPTT